MITIQVNGESENIENSTLLNYIQAKGLKPETVVIELNGDIIKKDRWPEYQMKHNDILEIVNFVGGG